MPPDFPAVRLSLFEAWSVRVLIRDLSNGRSALEPHLAALESTGGEQLLPECLRLIDGGKFHADERLAWIVHGARDHVGGGAALCPSCRVLVEQQLPLVIV